MKRGILVDDERERKKLKTESKPNVEEPSDDEIFKKIKNFGSEIRPLFQLDPDGIFLNHGMVGACPKVVIEEQCKIQKIVEAHPAKFFNRDRLPLIKNAQTELARFVGADPDDIVFISNATTGVNAVLRSLDLQQEDSVLCLSLAYPPVRNTLRYICVYLQEIVDLMELEVALPIDDVDKFVECVGNAIANNTRLAVFDSITSPTGVVLPIQKLIDVCHSKGVPVLIDGAHAPGQIPNLNLSTLGADYFVGTCYKWLFSPKGCAFLYVEKSLQSSVKPVVTSHGYNKGFQLEFACQGIRDETPFLCIPAALKFYRSLGVDKVFKYNHSLVTWAAKYLADKWETEVLNPPDMCGFMSVVRVPVDSTIDGADKIMKSDGCRRLMDLLFDRYYIDASTIFIFNDQMYMRISAQVYNERSDYIQLGDAVLEIIEGGAL